ncbi:calmodulin-like protein [Canna indica]|uniref:Calmodulin-like protein n=1 Tax=Canna indica TaxID=4628 RepID=A0AAQ3QBV4_9LILI|nr:calmodulin-like protein [Canna indica]
MALIYTRSVSGGEMSAEEFKEWLKKFDVDKDGRISKAELREAIRSRGRRFAALRSSRRFRQADTDQNGFIDDAEISNLVKFAKNNFGISISPY